MFPILQLYTATPDSPCCRKGRIMREKSLVIYYPEKSFTERFSSYLERRSGLPLRCHAFTDRAAFQAYLKKNEADLILLPAGESLEEVPSAPVLYLAEKSESQLEGELPLYRRMDKQVGQIGQVLDLGEGEAEKTRPGAELLGFYSPVHGAGQSVSAILMGMILAEKAPTLLLCLERFSGLKEIFPAGDGSLSELLYFARVQGSFLPQLKEVTSFFGPLAYVPPARQPEDLVQTGPEDWRFLLKTLKDSGLYRYILIDIGDGVRPEKEVLELCERVYVPVREDRIALSKLTEWQDQLREQGAEALLKRLRTYRLPLPGPDRIVEYRELRYLPWGRTIKALADGES